MINIVKSIAINNVKSIAINIVKSIAIIIVKSSAIIIVKKIAISSKVLVWVFCCRRSPEVVQAKLFHRFPG